MVIIERVLTLLQLENEAAGKTLQFAILKPWLTIAGTSEPQTNVAERLGTTVGALRVMIYRLRKRFRELVRKEISQTLNNPSDLEAEMGHLITALSFEQ